MRGDRKDYREFRAALVEMDRILSTTGIEERFVADRIASYEIPIKSRLVRRHCNTLRLALRHTILLAITGHPYRELARRLADSHLFQWFTRTGFVDAVRPVSKSTLERFEKLFDADAVAVLIHELNRAVANATGAQNLLYRETALRFDAIFADSTCVKANIHFPVDWVLLRDAARTLTSAISLIRGRGLKHRIGPPLRISESSATSISSKEKALNRRLGKRNTAQVPSPDTSRITSECSRVGRKEWERGQYETQRGCRNP